MNGVTFDDLRWLNLLWAALLALLVGIYGAWQRRRALRLFSTLNLLPKLAPAGGWLRPLVRLALAAICLLCLTGAIIGPRWGQAEQLVVRRNIDVMVLLDVSRSMLARDIAPNRLERAKLSIRDDLLPALGGDRVGLIAFAGAATLTCPLTDDYGFLRLVLDELSTTSVPRGGTLIGDAIRKASECFPKSLDSHKVVLLITDGEDHESYPIDAAKAIWKDQGVPIVAVALGDEREGARIPVESPRGEKYLEHEGQTVWSKANFDDLRSIAAVSDLNAFIPVGTRNFDLGDIYKQRIVPLIKHKEMSEKKQVLSPSQYHLFAVAALAALLLDSFLRDGPRRSPARLAMRNERGLAA
ncbi:von Willebrand factor type A domain protein [Phycisphaerae bacterium RAS1]|nr:von Willebrand factor type A domain protein [Phycisphaerae bacterium RAS1]